VNTPPQVERAILEGLRYRASDLAPRTRKQLDRAVEELLTAPGLDLAVLRRAAELWNRLGYDRPLTVRGLVYAYPALASEHRRVKAREERMAREERELWKSLGHTPSWLRRSG